MISAKVSRAARRIAIFLTCGALAAFGQEATGNAKSDQPRFVAADARVTANRLAPIRPPLARGDFFEARNTTMADLISFAYDTPTIKVVGGPSWLEMDRFDVLARQPSQTAQDQTRLMLRGLLADRFKLVVREETRPLTNYAITASAKHKLKEADGSGTTGCAPQSSNAPPGTAGGGVISFATSVNGGTATPVQISLADGMIEYKCRNMTMPAFATALRGLIGANLGVNPILDQTSLTGMWNFDLKYSLGLVGLPGASGNQITIFEAVDKQLGLKLEEKPVPTTVVAVQSVDQKPSENPSNTAELLARPAVPKAFDVASIKPTPPGNNRITSQMQPGGRLVMEGYPLTLLVRQAFAPTNSSELVGVPDWAGNARFEVMAQAQMENPQASLDSDAVAPMMLSLLQERFGLTFHREQREVQAYNLVASKPKMKKADPSARSWCKAPAQVPGAAPAPQGSQALICQNITMSQFAELLRGKTPELQTPVVDSTSLEGAWDFRLTFNPVIGQLALRTATADPSATVAIGANPDLATGVSIFEAVEKQLGLKLEKVKRVATVTVIDHLDQTPTEN